MFYISRPSRESGGSVNVNIQNKTITQIKKETKNTTVYQKFVMADQANKESYLSLSVERKQELVKKAEGCSTRATMQLLSEVDPSLSVPREQARFLGKGKVEIKVIVDESCHKKLEELKNLLSHKNPSLSYGELLLILTDEALEKHDPVRKRTKKRSMKKKAITSAEKLESQQAKTPATTSLEKGKYAGKAKKLSRAIPSALKRHIWKRDEGKCSYVHPKTKRRCCSKHLLQIDHIKPFSLGGRSELNNLRLLCAGHNQFRSEKTFRL